MAKKIPDDVFRIIKIGRDALFEFICENIVEEQARLLNLDPRSAIVSCFEIDWENGDLIFLARNEREKCDDLELPDELDLPLLMSKMSETASGLFSSKRKYVDLTLDDIIDIQTVE